MKKHKRIISLALCALMLGVAEVMAGCNKQPTQQPTQPSEATTASYQVKVTDGLGNPYTTGVVVRFLKDGQQAAVQVVDENGIAKKEMEKGDYTVEAEFTDDGESYYDKTAAVLSGDKTELQLVLAHAVSGQGVELFAKGEPQTAYPVSTGSTYVKLQKGTRNYFLFEPSIMGTYAFSVTGNGETIGYYGAPHFVLDNSIAELENGTFTVSVSTSMISTEGGGTSVMVLGIDAASADGCILNIQRIGDAEKGIEDEPWIEYKTTATLAPYTLAPGANIHEFDLAASTDTYNLVYNEADGFYHLDSPDGPLVLVRLGVKSKYLDSFQTILENSAVVKYFFDEDGNFIKKERYNDCLLAYIENMDADNGVYPLTEDLKYIIQQNGDHSSWWDPDGPGYLFGGVDFVLNPDIAWLFMCCYVSQS